MNIALTGQKNTNSILHKKPAPKADVANVEVSQVPSDGLDESLAGRLKDGHIDGVKWTSSFDESEAVHQKATTKQKLVALAGAGATVAIGAGLIAGGALATPLAATLTLGAAVGAFFATDVGTGVVHHFLDNINADDMEAKGGKVRQFTARIARDFQNHHSHTRDMVHRDYAHHTADTQKMTTPILIGLAAVAGLATAAAPMVVGPLVAGLATITNLANVAQEAHKRSHMSDEENPAWVRGLQKTGIWVNQDVHNSHHTEGHKSHYALLNGLTNKVLDGAKFKLTPNGPKSNILRKLEVALYKMQGSEPNAWLENEGLKEEALGTK